MSCQHRWGKVRKDGTQRCVECKIEYEHQLYENKACNHPKWKFDDYIGKTEENEVRRHTGQIVECCRCGWIKVISYGTSSTNAL